MKINICSKLKIDPIIYINQKNRLRIKGYIGIDQKINGGLKP